MVDFAWSPRLEEKDLETKVDRIRLALEGFQRDATAKPQIAELMEAVLLDPGFPIGCGTFAHAISRHALIFAGFSRETRPRRVTPSG